MSSVLDTEEDASKLTFGKAGTLFFTHPEDNEYAQYMTNEELFGVLLKYPDNSTEYAPLGDSSVMFVMCVWIYMYKYMYVCMYCVCMYKYMYVCIYVCSMYVQYVCMYICVYTHVRIHLYTHTYIPTYIL